MSDFRLVRVALPVPLRRLFDYQSPIPLPPIGGRVKVPFGRQELIGIVIDHPQESSLDSTKLKSIIEPLDDTDLLPHSLHTLIQQSAQYYQHSLGETYATALPNALMKGEPAVVKSEFGYQITPQGKQEWESLPTRSVRLRSAMALLSQSEGMVSKEELHQNDIESATLTNLAKKGWIDKKEVSADSTISSNHNPLSQAKLTLNSEQALAVEAIEKQINHFSSLLLDGVTGSGKTEVYLQSIEKVLNNHQQALVLIPEIGLTPQTLTRFESRFPGLVGTMHSGMTDHQRLQTWLKARSGRFKVVVGTRSAIFTPFENLGMIIIDEEHDLSFKQQEGLRYSSRDLAILRAKIENIPVVLGSATPSLETLFNVQQNRFIHLTLTERAQQSQLPKIRVIDCKNQPLVEGFSQQTLQAIKTHLNQQHQVLVFINRRGFAPVLLCHQCGWISECRRCDSYLTLHQSKSNDYLQCHHCGHYQSMPKDCPKCHSTELIAVGQGTERVEQFLAKEFPEFPLQRIDRDTTRRKQSMSDYIAAAKSGETRLLVGTQMIAKGHHFPKVSLVVILNMDGALFSSDFRAPERAAQLITQVAGRAGREEIKGEVLIQTHHPEHSLLRQIPALNYSDIANHLLAERQSAELPPISKAALFRAESLNKQAAFEFLQFVANQFQPYQQRIEILGPVSSTIARKAGRFRFQLLLNAPDRQSLHSVISEKLPIIEENKLANKVRWSLDIDPMDLL